MRQIAALFRVISVRFRVLVGSRSSYRSLLQFAMAAGVGSLTLIDTSAVEAGGLSPLEMAQEVDRLVLSNHADGDYDIVDESVFLRRVSLDLIGRPPSAAEITSFGLDPSPDKRARVVAQLLESDGYAANWSYYWRDAIFMRATNARARLVQPAFESWMAENLRENRGWDEIVTDLITASGSVNDNGAAALIFAQEGEPEDIAAETSRLFLGIQIQCANCHDHPWDRWKREQFHEFAAFFPRVSVRRDRNSDRMIDYEIASVNRDRTRRPGVTQFLLTRVDRNRDGYLTEAEAKNTPLQRVFSQPAVSYVDKDGDGRISLEEIRTAQPPTNNRPGQGSVEHRMTDLSDPGSEGDLIHPSFFLNEDRVRRGQDDLTRRQTAASLVTAQENPWFARAIVNRMWAELNGSAFYTPVDDIGPDRSAEHSEALDVLSAGFTQSGYDLRWLISAITNTRLYQRPVNTEAEGFVYLEPARLRADQFYDALCQTLNVTAIPLQFQGRRTPYARTQDQGRLQFSAIFGFDPSTPRSDLTGQIPEALFLMNSPQIHGAVQANTDNSTIGRISRRVLTDEDVIRELYLETVSREPTDQEVQICIEHVSASDSRKEGFEDVMWSLLNSSEYQSRR